MALAQRPGSRGRRARASSLACDQRPSHASPRSPDARAAPEPSLLNNASLSSRATMGLGGSPLACLLAGWLELLFHWPLPPAERLVSCSSSDARLQEAARSRRLDPDSCKAQLLARICTLRAHSTSGLSWPLLAPTLVAPVLALCFYSNRNLPAPSDFETRNEQQVRSRCGALGTIARSRPALVAAFASLGPQVPSRRTESCRRASCASDKGCGR